MRCSRSAPASPRGMTPADSEAAWSRSSSTRFSWRDAGSDKWGSQPRLSQACPPCQRPPSTASRLPRHRCLHCALLARVHFCPSPPHPGPSASLVCTQRCSQCSSSSSSSWTVSAAQKELLSRSKSREQRHSGHRKHMTDWEHHHGTPRDRAQRGEAEDARCSAWLTRLCCTPCYTPRSPANPHAAARHPAATAAAVKAIGRLLPVLGPPSARNAFERVENGLDTVQRQK